MKTVKIGDKVTFQDGGGHTHTGIVKRIHKVFVQDEKGSLREVFVSDLKVVNP